MKSKTFWLEAWKHMMHHNGNIICINDCINCEYNWNGEIFQDNDDIHLTLKIIMGDKFKE